MSDSHAKPSHGQLVLNQLRHPFKLRAVLCISILAGWYFIFLSPLNEELTRTASKISKERKRIAAAREIEELRKTLAPYRARVPAKSELNELIRHTMTMLRPTRLKLIDLKPEKTKDLSPFEAVGLRLVLEGAYSDLDEFLTKVENGQLLLRVDALRVEPDPKAPTNLNIQLSLISLVEKEKAPPNRGPAPGKA